MKIKITLAILIAFVGGFLVSNFSKEKSLEITYLQKFEIQDSSPDYITVKGAYKDSSQDINLVNLECNLKTDTCVESPTFITKDGITGIVQLKEYKIIDKSPTRVVAEYRGLAAFHTFTIDLATKKASFKNEDNDSSNFETYELVDGQTILDSLN